MAKWWWNDQGTFESLVFKRVPLGWIYRSPIQWGPFGIGRASHFLLSDTQKDEISKILYRVDRYLALTLVILFLPAFFLLWSFRAAMFSMPLSAVAILALCLLAAQYAWTSIYWLMLRRSLAKAQPTSERIAFGERFNVVATAAPRGFLIFYAASFAALLVFYGYVAFRMKIWDWSAPAMMILAAGGIALFLALLAAKRRAKQN